MRRKAFTLIELIVVIAIIAILAAIIAPNAFKAVEKAKISGSIEDVRSIKTGAMAYYSDVGTWPVNCTDATTCSASAFITSTTISGWDGPYLEKWPQRAKWGGNYTWRNVATGVQFGSTPVGGTGERWVTIETVPSTAADKIDRQMDGTNNSNSGDVRFGAGTSVSVNISVSRDGPVN